MDLFITYYQEALLLALKVLLPLFVAAFLAGTFFSFLGNFFQVQDISFVQIPKIFLTGLVLLLFLPWQFELLREYFIDLFSLFYQKGF